MAIEHDNQPKHLPRLRYATKDAMEFAEAIQCIGVDEDDIKMLLDSNAPAATERDTKHKA